MQMSQQLLQETDDLLKKHDEESINELVSLTALIGWNAGRYNGLWSSRDISVVGQRGGHVLCEVKR